MANISVETKVDLPENLIDILIAHSELKTYSAGEIVFAAGDKAEYVYLIKQGRVKICHFAHNGSSVTLLIHTKGEMLGLGAVIDDSVLAIYGVAARDNTQLWRISARDFLHLLETNHEFSRSVTTVLARRMKALDTQILHQVSIRAKDRITVILFDLAIKQGVEDNGRVKIKITQQEIADFLGACRQTTTSMLHGLKEKGLIDIKKGYIFVNDLKALQKEALKNGS